MQKRPKRQKECVRGKYWHNVGGGNIVMGGGEDTVFDA
jgi:hypothetical protein